MRTLLPALLAAAGLSSAGCLADPGAEQNGSALGDPVDRTLLVWAANDDPNPRLTAGFDADADEWERFVGGSKRFRVVVQRDYSRRNPGNPATERYVLERGVKLHPVTLEPGSLTLGETNTSDPAVLRTFLEESIRAFPAERTWLVVTGHGDNWMGLAPDETDPLGRAMPLSGFRDAIAAAEAGALAEVRAAVPGSPRLDVVQLDACRMGSVEVATALAGVADHLVASQQNEPAAGHPYGAFYSLAQNHLGTSPRTAVAEIVLDYVRSYNATLSTRSGRYVGTSVTSVALDLGAMDGLVESLGQLAGAMRAERPAGLSCSEIEAIRAALVAREHVEADASAGAPPDTRPVAARAAVDLGALLRTLTAGEVPGAPLGAAVRDAATRALGVIGRPDDRFDPNRQWGFIRLVGFPAGSPFITEAHSLTAADGPAPTGLSILFGDAGPLLARANGPAPLDTYRALPFETETTGSGAAWTSVLGGCIGEQTAE